MACGTDKGLYLLEVSIGCVVDRASRVNQALEAVKFGLKNGSGNLLFAFKVIGENRAVFVIRDGIESAVENLNRTQGTYISTCCTPLIEYASFARDTLKLDPELLDQVKFELPKDPEGIYLWLTATVEYKGMSVETLIEHWHDEATTVWKNKLATGEGDYILYKNATQKIVHNFCKVDSLENMDHLMFDGLPIYKKMGNQIGVVTKRVKILA